MKSFLNALLIAVSVVVLSIVSSLGYNYYTNQPSSGSEDTLVSADVQTVVAQVLNPTFTSVDDVFEFYEQKVEQNSIDSTFMTIPHEALVNITQVIIGRKGNASIKDIVCEFRQKYKDIYQYIKPQESVQNKLEAPTQDVYLNAPPKNKEDAGRDTTIDGQTYKIIKLE